MSEPSEQQVSDDPPPPAGRAGRPAGGVPGRPAVRAQAGEYEYRVITLPPRVSRADARRLLTEHAEYGRWELARVRLYAGGVRRVWLRRRIIRVIRTA